MRTERGADTRPLPAGTDLAAYRIVQEALTNVIRHAHAHNVTVRVAYSETSLDLEVEADGDGGAAVSAGAARVNARATKSAAARAATSGGAADRGAAGVGETAGRGGNGIPGMRERARLLGGELTAGPLPGRGFRVRARLPLGGRDAEATGEPAAPGTNGRGHGARRGRPHER